MPDISKSGANAVLRVPTDGPIIVKAGAVCVLRPVNRVQITKAGVVAVLRPSNNQRRRMSFM